jgi:hypothetical protein
MFRLRDWRNAVWIAATMLLVTAAVGPSAALAQAGGSVRITTLISENFPDLTLYVSALDDRGNHLAGLGSADFVLQEDGDPIPVLGAESIRAGARQIFLINTTPGMQLKDPLGFRLYDHVRQDLFRWWATEAASEYGIDDLTLLTEEGPIVTHSTLAAELASQLAALEPEFEATGSIGDLLVQALTYTSNPARQVGISNQLVFLTPPIDEPAERFLGDTIALANNTDTTIHVVQVSRQEDPEEPIAIDENLRQLTEATGGTFILYDPEVGLDALEERVLGHRTLYKLSARSSANTGGPHTVRVRVDAGDMQTDTSAASYDLLVLPPELTFIQPPTSILRQPTNPGKPIESLAPDSVSLEILITFPDGHPRDLISSRLIVDGGTVEEKVAAPFTQFEWNLGAYATNRTHTVRAAALDTLGMEAYSEELSVLVEVPPPPGGWEALSPALQPLMVGVGILIATVLGATAVIVMLRRRAEAPAPARPATRGRIWSERASLRPSKDRLSAEAWLKPEAADGKAAKPIPLTGAELTLGSDASLSTVPLDDPSVSRMHAQLLRRAGGEYVIRDQNSTAGTWVNFEPVPEGGRRLQHGDLIQIGRVALRFEMSAPPPPREIRIGTPPREPYLSYRSTEEDSPESGPPSSGTADDPQA